MSSWHAGAMTFRTCTAKAEPITSNLLFLFDRICEPNFVTSTRFGIHARAHTHTCGRTPHLRHTFAVQAFPETGLGWQNAQYNRARNHGDAKQPRKTCLVIYCCIFNSHCRQAAFCSSSSTGVTPKPTSHLNTWPMLMVTHAHGDHARSWNSKVATLFPIILVAAGRKESRQKEWIVCGISMVRRRGGCTQTITNHYVES